MSGTEDMETKAYHLIVGLKAITLTVFAQCTAFRDGQVKIGLTAQPHLQSQGAKIADNMPCTN